jgi:hypothetical protein
MYGRCTEGSLDQRSRGILAVRKRTVSYVCLVGRKNEDDDRTPTGADTRTTSPYISRHFKLTYLHSDVYVNDSLLTRG